MIPNAKTHYAKYTNTKMHVIEHHNTVINGLIALVTTILQHIDKWYIDNDSKRLMYCVGKDKFVGTIHVNAFEQDIDCWKFNKIGHK